MKTQFTYSGHAHLRAVGWHRPVCALTGFLFSALIAGCQGGSPHVAESGDAFETLGNCTNTCEFANDGICDDGGPNSFSRSCELGTDCGDCGIRAESSRSDDDSTRDPDDDSFDGSFDNASDADDPVTDDSVDSTDGSDASGSGSDSVDAGGDSVDAPAGGDTETGDTSDPADDGATGGGGIGGGGFGGGGGGGSTAPGGDPVVENPPAEPTVTPENGNYAAKYVVLEDTSEAELMVRVGDIDNLNNGFEAFFDPFSGNITPPHDFPWTLDPTDPEGTDRIMVITSYVGRSEEDADGYSRDTSRPENSVRPITLEYSLEGRALAGAIIQIFIDDMQAPRWGADYKITLNGLRARFMESRLNVLDQDGPVGQLISIDVPDEFMSEVSSGRLEIKIDDLTTGAGDGYAVDFVKLLINPHIVLQTGQLVGQVVDAETGAPIEGATVTSGGGATDTTDANGDYLLNDVPAGLAIVEVTREGYNPLTQSVTLVEDDVAELNFDLVKTP
ncbi:MAG TPA: carboxypeptidase-like regulatory domain-containing protein [Phycisphaerae bacterium]|nr:carboxypeptidase-like regulatory domain-containing protein [Phycisphaerae bacterium]